MKHIGGYDGFGHDYVQYEELGERDRAFASVGLGGMSADAQQKFLDAVERMLQKMRKVLDDSESREGK